MAAVVTSTPCRRPGAGVVVTGALLALAGLAASAAPLAPATPATPLVNLGIEVRVVDEGAADAASGRADVVVATHRAADADAGQAMQVQVLAGQWAILRLNRELPLQWLQAAAGGGAASGAASAAAGGRSAASHGGVVGGLAWLHAGRALAVRPIWPGGRGDVIVEIRYEAAAVDEVDGGGLPAQRSLQAGTTLRLPPGRWATFAVTGTAAGEDEPPAGVTTTTTSTARSQRNRQLLQLRVTAP